MTESRSSGADSQPLQVYVVPVTPFRQNASVLVSTATGKAAVVDPGGDIEALMAAVAESGATVEKILLTHGHLDHAGAAAELAERLGVPIEGPHEADRFLLDELPTAGRRYGIETMRAVSPDRFLVEGDQVSVGDLVFDVLHVPGHTPGHVVFVLPAAGFALVGDTLFAGSVGRTDFPYGDGEGLVDNIRRKLLPLGDHVTVLPGHGRATTIGEERRSNPYIA